MAETRAAGDVTSVAQRRSTDHGSDSNHSSNAEALESKMEWWVVARRLDVPKELVQCQLALSCLVHFTELLTNMGLPQRLLLRDWVCFLPEDTFHMSGAV